MLNADWVHHLPSEYVELCADNPTEQIRPNDALPIKKTRSACTVEGCEKNYSRRQDLDRHIGEQHSLIDRKKCFIDGCTRSFPRKDNFKRHVRKCHPFSADRVRGV